MHEPPPPITHHPSPITSPRLRVARTTLYGREAQEAAAIDLLRRDHVRLLTLIGPGGVGKTRLAVRIAEVMDGEFADGVASVDLAGVRDPELLPRTVAFALGLRLDGDEAWLAAIVRALAERHLLLLIDNLEHLMAAAPDLARIIEGAPRVKLLVTSRERVPLANAHHLQIPPLTLPSDNDDPARIAATPSVRLFVDRARAIDDRFALTTENAAQIARICRRLDGLPLAIELAAARANALPPAALFARLDHALALLTRGPLDLAERHRTLRGAIAWGYDLLDPAMQSLFRRLSVFHGGFTLAAAERVGSRGVEESRSRDEDGPTPDTRYPSPVTFDLLAGLIDRSMVVLVDDDGDEPRYRMLETLREFGREMLAASAEEERATLDRHAAWVLMLITARMGKALRLIQEDEAFAQLDLETDNIRAALAHVVAVGDGETALRLIGGLWLYWTTRGSLRDDERWVDRILERPAIRTAPPAARADGLAAAAWVKALRGQGSAAEGLARDAVAASRDAGDLAAEARASVMLSLAHSVLGHADRALIVAGTAVELARRAADRDWLPFALNRQGMALVSQGDYQAAVPLFEEALAGWQANAFGWGIGTALENLGHVTCRLGDWGRALEYFHGQLRLPGHPSDAWGIVNTLGGLAEIAISGGDPARGGRLLGAAGRMLEESGITLAAHEAENRDRALTAARLVLGEERLATEEAAGRHLSYEEVMATGLAVSAPGDGLPTSAAGLSPREIEALQLLAAGRTDREIADRLFLSVRTVESHLASARRKLGANNRIEAATAAIRLGLTRRASDDPSGV